MKGVMKQGNFESAMILVRSEIEQSGLSRKQDVFPRTIILNRTFHFKMQKAMLL
ncbi:hypothetical protein KUH03_14685 [Sphingobacterium sp. E70]|uniref:hypothetical protein n=1 Tax=Sphingobacterium sp. E70 TaxID=2853439 RepID=UPI00211C3FC8|nr:hypothetical protein [Sphingobacterium sp. E70]ULT27786.1 hypothetical protein KUH03_14685 [Sphingobacterium sp. E70]